MELQFEPISSIFPYRVALIYGPVWLILKGNEGGLLAGDISKPEDWIKPDLEHQLHFQIPNQGTGRFFVPLYELQEPGDYFTNNDISSPE